MCSFTSFAQEATDVDQLKKELSLPKILLVRKITILNQLAEAYVRKDSVNTFLYSNQAIALAEKTGDISAKGKGYFTQAIYYYEHLKINKALSLYQKVAQMQKEIGNKLEYASALLGIGKSYIGISKYEEAKPNLEQALAIFKLQQHKQGQISCYNSLGIVNSSIGKKDVAIENYISSLKIISTLKDEPGFVEAQTNIATLYSDMGQFDKAKEIFIATIPAAEKKGDYFAKYRIFSNLGNMYLNEGNYAEATRVTKEAADYYEKIKFKYGLFVSYNNLGAIKIRQKSYLAAVPLLQQSLRNIDPKNDKSSLVIIQQNIAYAYTMAGDYESATKWFDMAKAETLNSRITPYALGELYNHLSTLDSLKGDYQNALDHKNKYYGFANKQLNEKISKQVNELQMKYETSKKEAQIFLLNKENAIKALQLNNNALEISRNKSLLTTQQQQITINGLELSNKNQALANQKLDAQKKAQDIKALQKQSRIQNLEFANKKLELEQRNLAMGSILIIFLALGGISFSYYKRNQLKQQNLLQTEIYKQQEIATKSVFEGEQNERIRIARDLHDGIGQMLSVVKMNVSTLNPEDKTVEGTLNLVDKTIAELRTVSHNLIPEALNFGLFSALEDICQKINGAGKTKAVLTVTEELQGQKLAQQNELSIYRIVQEVLNNMIKHANASHIAIDIKKVNDNMLIAIKDDGEGFDTSKIDDSKGIGWKNISARVHLMDGDMNIKSEKLIGTQIEISIPA